jgi:hypothetical protein
MIESRLDATAGGSRGIRNDDDDNDDDEEIEDLLYSLLTRKEVSVGWKDTSVPHLLGYGSLLYVVEQLLMYPSDLLKTRLQVDLRPDSNISKVSLGVGTKGPHSRMSQQS